MDRMIVISGQQPLETDILNGNKFAMLGLGHLAEAAIGSSVGVSGCGISPTSPATMTVNIARGSIYTPLDVDDVAYSALGTDTSTVVKQGISYATVPLTLTAPATSGYSQIYLVCASYSDVDGGAVVRNYYNSAAAVVSGGTVVFPAPLSGPGNTGATDNTIRYGKLNVTLVPGAAAPSGSQVAPSVPLGSYALYQITVSNGQTQITSANWDIVPGAPFFVNLENLQVRKRLTTNADFYVNATAGNDNNTGTSTFPWATLQKAWNYIQAYIDLNGFTATVHCTGSFTAGLVAQGTILGQNSALSLVFIGNTGSPSSVPVSVTNASAFTAGNGARLTVKGFKVAATGSLPNGGGLAASNGGVVQYSNIEFGSCSVAHIYGVVNGQVVGLPGALASTISASSPCHGFADVDGYVDFGATVYTITGTPAFSTAFAFQQMGGQVVAYNGVTFSGAATGTKYSGTYGGGVYTLGTNSGLGTGANFFPGSIAGSVTTPSVFN